jgi:hypothetical protein
VLKTNLEAVKEIVRQLRFRNIGGLIIIDLIDMETAENREKVYRALQDAMREDKARTNLLKISELGLVEMTRKRTRENLMQQLCEPCSYCEGRGYVLSGESVAYKVLREIRNDLPRFCGRQIAVTVNPRVAEMLLGPAHKALAALGEDLGREIEIRARPTLHQAQFEVMALDAGPPVSLSLSWLTEPGASDQVVASEAEKESDQVVASEAEKESDQVVASEAEKESAPPDADEEKPAEVVAEAVSPAEGAESAPPEAARPAEGAESTPPQAVELEEPDPDAKPEPGEPAAPAGAEEPVAASAPVELVDVEAENRILPRAERPEEG